jgi:hypothetical protein
MKQSFTFFKRPYWNKNNIKRTAGKPNIYYLLFSLLVLFSGTINLHSQTINHVINAVTLDRGSDCNDYVCGNNNDKVLLCHVPPGNPNNEHEICISPSASHAHLAHGDYCGPCILLSNEDQVNLKSISIYPNPFTNSFFVELSQEILINNEDLELIIYDLLGRSVKRVTLIKTGKIEMDMSELNNGMFIYNISSGKEIIGTGKILKY